MLSTCGDENYDVTINFLTSSYLCMLFHSNGKDMFNTVNKVKIDDSVQEEFILRILKTKKDVHVSWYMKYIFGRSLKSHLNGLFCLKTVI